MLNLNPTPAQILAKYRTLKAWGLPHFEAVQSAMMFAPDRLRRITRSYYMSKRAPWFRHETLVLYERNRRERERIERIRAEVYARMS